MSSFLAIRTHIDKYSKYKEITCGRDEWGMRLWRWLGDTDYYEGKIKLAGWTYLEDRNHGRRAFQNGLDWAMEEKVRPIAR